MHDLFSGHGPRLTRAFFVFVFSTMTAWSAFCADAGPAKPAAPPPSAKPVDTSRIAVESATALRAAGKLEQAIQVLRDANRDLKTTEGDESLGLVPVNNLAAEILTELDQTKAAGDVAEKTLSIHESLIKSGKVSPESLGVTLLVMARIESQKKDVLGAIQSAAKAVPLLVTLEGPRGKSVSRGCELLAKSADSLEQMLGPADSMTSDNRKKAADVFESIGRFDDAISQRKGIFRSASAREVPAAIEEAAEQLGRLMAMTGRAEEATTIFESAAEPSASRLRLLGDLRLAANKLLAADTAYEAATKASGGTAKAAPSAAARDRLARLLVSVRRGRVKALPDWFEGAWTPLTKAAQGDPVTIGSLIASSSVLASLGDPLASVKPLTGALAVLKKQRLDPSKVRNSPAPAKPAATPAPTSGSPPVAKTPAPSAPKPAPKAVPPGKPAPQAAPALVVKPPFPPAKPAPQGITTPLITEVTARLAGAHFASGNFSAALLVAQPELSPAENTLGPGDGRLSLLRAIAAAAAIGPGEKEKTMALALATDALAYGLPRPDDAWEEILTAAFDRLAANDSATDWRNEFIAARSRQFGENHPHVATAWGCFGTARLAAADWPSAVTCFSKAREVYQAALGKDHPHVAASTAMLAHAQRLGGDLTEAAGTAEEAVILLEKRVGRNHPATLEAVDVLVAARLQANIREGVSELLERLCTSETMLDPVRRAYHLARLGEVTAPVDKAAARARVQAAMSLPCWTDDKNLRPLQRRQLADTAAYVARVYRLLGDDTAAQTTLNRARSIALRIDESGGLLDRIERLAAPES